MIAGIDPATQIAIVIGLMIALSVVLVAVAFAGGGSRRYNRRLREVTSRTPGGARPEAGEVRSLARRSSATPGIDRLFQLLPRREILVDRLGRTGREISVGQYMLVSIGLSLAAAIAIFIFLKLSPVTSVLLGGAVGMFLPHYIIGRMGRRRIAAFINLFPEAIDLMVRALRAGLPISEAIVNAGQEIGDPVGSEFRTIEAGMRLGRDLDALLWEIGKRISASEFRFFVIALNVQRETGGNLAETLNNLSNVIRARRAARAKARAMASEARASTMILGCLPMLVMVVLGITSPNYIAPLFSDVRGLMLIGVAVLMLVTGISIMVRMARFEI